MMMIRQIVAFCLFAALRAGVPCGAFSARPTQIRTAVLEKSNAARRQQSTTRSMQVFPFVGEGSSVRRLKVLHERLHVMGIDAYDLHDAAFRPYDHKYGGAVIRCYRGFVEAKRSNGCLLAEANNCAKKIDALWRDYKRRHDDWIADDATAELSSARRMFPLVLVLDNIHSATNVGSILRTADACGCELVITTGITPHPGGKGDVALSKSSSGAEQVVKTLHSATTKAALEYIRKERPDYQIVAMDTSKRSVPYTDYEYPAAGIALVLGNEVSHDVSEELFHAVVEIPMHGENNNLNIAACAPVVLYEVLRQWKTQQQGDNIVHKTLKKFGFPAGRP